MGKKERYLCLVYIGTTKVAFAKARVRSDGRTEVLALSARLSHGFERGIVKDLEQASQSLNAAIEDVLETEDRSVLPCRLVVSNVYLKNYTYQSSVYFHNNPHPVTLRDVRAVIAQTRSVATIPLQELIVQAVPQEFLVNDLAGVQNPLGLEASRLGVTLRLLTFDFSVYHNLLRVFERCDLEITEVIPSVLAAAHCVLTPLEKQSGVILGVVGGQATHFACYRNSVLIETRSIPVGSDCITEALEKNLNVGHLDAQRLKESFGSANPKTEFQDELIPVPEPASGRKYTIKRTEFEFQMKTGLIFFFEEIKKEIESLQKCYPPLDQIVLTGGGVQLEGFLDVIQDSLPFSVRIGTAQGIVGPQALVSDPAFSGILGGVGFSSKVSEKGLAPSARQNWLSRTVEGARNWIFEYL